MVVVISAKLDFFISKVIEFADIFELQVIFSKTFRIIAVVLETLKTLD